ncbi:MAG: hypothetical protein KGH69_00820 [Candidatus Micrarchaeota archaeon]|nr:hypothetical protein [Candidatus Micrarchaeota archaeon]
MARDIQILTLVLLLSVVFALGVFISLIPAQLWPVSVVLAIIALALDVIAFANKFYFYLAEPLRKMKNRVITIQQEDSFYMYPSGSAIAIRNGSEVTASAFVKIPVYRSATEMTDEEKMNFARLFARVVTMSKYPIRISAEQYVINKDEFIDKISKKLSDAQQKYTSITSNKDAPRNEVDRIEGELTMWHNLFANVTKARSQGQMAFAMVSAVGASEEEAVNLATQKAEEIAAGISATLGITAAVAHGEEILAFLEPEYMIPPTTVTEMMKKQEQGAQV